MKTTSLLVFFLTISSCLKAQVEEYSSISLDEEWLLYDWDEDIYIPYIPEVHKDVNALSLYVNFNDNQGKELIISYDSQVDVFIENKLYYSLDEGGGQLSIITSKLTNLNSLKESVFISFHSENSFTSIPRVIVTNNSSHQTGNYYFDKDELQNASYRGVMPFEKTNFLLLILGICSLLLLVKWTDNPLFYLFFPSAFLSFFFEKKVKEDMKTSVTDVLLFVLYVSLVVLVIFMNINQMQIVFFQVASSIFDSFSMLFSLNEKLVSSFLLLVSLFLLKILLIRITGRLYNLKSEINIHINEYIVITQFLFTILFIFTIINSFYPHVIKNTFILTALYYTFFIVSIIVCFRIYSIISFKKVYLISYFCITEFIPAAIILRLL